MNDVMDSDQTLSEGQLDIDSSKDNENVFSFMEETETEKETSSTILPPKPIKDTTPSQSKIGSASIKRLVENIASNKGIGGDQSRFANLYRESVGAQTENAESGSGSDKVSSVGSKFGALIDSIRNEKPKAEPV